MPRRRCRGILWGCGNAIPGWRLQLLALDDSSDPAIGESAARQLATDEAALGVVGTYNSGVAARVAPVLDEAGLVISPANTDPALTLAADIGRPQRPHANYFRMIASDNLQGQFLAGHALSDLRFRRAAVVSETKAVSKGLADVFTTAFTAGGGTVVERTVVPDGTTNFDDVLRPTAPLRPDLLFFGGEYPVGAQFTHQAVAAGLRVPVMGGDASRTTVTSPRRGQRATATSPARSVRRWAPSPPPNRSSTPTGPPVSGSPQPTTAPMPMTPPTC